MYEGYIAVNGIEIGNAERVGTYLSGALGNLDWVCREEGIRRVLGKSTAYTTPLGDDAPWVNSSAASKDFLGFYPTSITGASDSTRTTTVTELTGNGAAHSMPRHTSKEIRVKGTMFATTAEALELGFTWLKVVLTEPDCESVFGLGCTGRDVTMVNALPVPGRATPSNLKRTFYECEVIDGPLVLKSLDLKKGFAREVEFVINAGKPWAFKPIQNVATIGFTDALNYQDPAGENCALKTDAYADFINDPYFTAIRKPPRPPIVAPPNLIKITSWRRKTIAIPATIGDEWGRTIPIVNVTTGSAPIQQLRMRFWHPNTTDTCGYDGEFLVSYLPAYSRLILNGIRRTIEVALPDGRVVPGGHLLFGSDGRPFQWPEMPCDTAYSMTADLMPGQEGVNVTLEVAVRQ